MLKPIVRQVWECPKCHYRYEGFVCSVAVGCSKNHKHVSMKLIEGEAFPVKTVKESVKKERPKTQRITTGEELLLLMGLHTKEKVNGNKAK